MKMIKILMLLLGAALIFSACASNKEKSPETVKVVKGGILASIPSTGTIMPRNRLEIKPPVAGRIESVLVVEGENIKQGQILGWMSSNERATLLDAARAKSEEELKYWEQVYKPVDHRAA